MIEALIFVSDEPLTAKAIADVLKEDKEVISETVAALAQEFNATKRRTATARGRWRLAVCDSARVSRARARVFEIAAERETHSRRWRLSR